jgi:hypothetical protein
VWLRGLRLFREVGRNARGLWKVLGHTGAVAFSRTGDPATGNFRDATVLRKFGDKWPDDLSASKLFNGTRQRFSGFIRYRIGGWLRCLLGLSPPDDLKALGYDLHGIDGGERIFHSAVVERFVRGADGALELLTVNSGKSVSG